MGCLLMLEHQITSAVVILEPYFNCFIGGDWTKLTEPEYSD